MSNIRLFATAKTLYTIHYTVLLYICYLFHLPEMKDVSGLIQGPQTAGRIPILVLNFGPVRLKN